MYNLYTRVPYSRIFVMISYILVRVKIMEDKSEVWVLFRSQPRQISYIFKQPTSPLFHSPLILSDCTFYFLGKIYSAMERAPSRDRCGKNSTNIHISGVDTFYKNYQIYHNFILSPFILEFVLCVFMYEAEDRS